MIIRKQTAVCRDTQETLAVLDRLDFDTSEAQTKEEIAKRFGWEDELLNDRMTKWMEIKPKVWALFDEPYSSSAAKVFFSIFL